jgi:hypothetical protein
MNGLLIGYADNNDQSHNGKGNWKDIAQGTTSCGSQDYHDFLSGVCR